MANRIDLLVQAVEPPRVKAATNSARSEPQLKQLPSRHDAVLARGLLMTAHQATVLPREQPWPEATVLVVSRGDEDGRAHAGEGAVEHACLDFVGADVHTVTKALSIQSGVNVVLMPSISAKSK